MTDKEVKRASCDPGWNDPPLFSFDHRAQLDQQQKQSGKRPSLNKRVVFPSTPPPPGGPPAQTPPISPFANKPPPPTPPPLAPPPMSPLASSAPATDGDTAGSPTSDDSGEEISLTEVMDNFKQTLSEVFGLEKEKQSSDVLRRLQTMETMWQDGKFDFKIKEKILSLSEALKTDDLKKADILQQSLMVDHSSLCSSWMSGVRNVLTSKRVNTISSNVELLTTD